jgi:hypothetical protein
MAHVQVLRDERASWPASIRLDGFTYERIYRSSPTTADERLVWLRSDDLRFSPQPYKNLARVLKGMGYEDEARKILVAMHADDQLTNRLTWVDRAKTRILGITIGYGYQPSLAGLWMLVFVALGAVIFHQEHRKGGITTTGPSKFNALVFSIDSFLPIIDLKESDAWSPRSTTARAYLWIHMAAGWVLSTLFAVGLSGLIRD